MHQRRYTVESILLLVMQSSSFSLTEIQNARGIMDVLAEMLNAVDPANREVYLFNLLE